MNYRKKKLKIIEVMPLLKEEYSCSPSIQKIGNASTETDLFCVLGIRDKLSVKTGRIQYFLHPSSES